MSGAGDPLAGLSLDRLDRWLPGAVPAAVAPLSARRIAGGRSNLTFRLSDAVGHRWILRRPPLGDYPATAHDVIREGRILAALGATALPVPEVLVSHQDPGLIAAPFVLMEEVEGTVCRGAAETARLLDDAARSRAGSALAETLAALHSVDPAAVGLDRLGRGEAYLERQLRRWHAQWEQQRPRRLAAIEEAHGILVGRVPEQSRTRIVHGDFRLDNCLLDRRGEVAAVLDWEICTLGDPLADLGLLLVYWAEPGDEVTALEDPPTLAPGFCGREAVRRRYEEAAGIDGAEIEFHVAFAWWKLACIVEGVYARCLRGALGEVDRSPASFARQAERLADQAQRAARALRSEPRAGF